jgi:hypothetical protein
VTTVAFSIIGGAVLGFTTAVIAIRWPFRKKTHGVWQLPIFVVVIAGMTVWAWHADHNGFPATFGPFILVQMGMGARMRRQQSERS